MSIQQLFFSSSAANKIVATGGTVYTNGNYKVHLFSASGTFSISEINDTNASLDVLVVAGGYTGIDGGSAEFDFDGRDGGGGGQGSYSRIYSGLAFGTYFNATNYAVTIAASDNFNSQVNNKTASPFIATGGQAIKLSGQGGSGAVYLSDNSTCISAATSGGAGETGYSTTWTGSTINYSSGAGGGGGGASDGSGCGTPGAGGAGGTGAGSGGAGGNFFGNGNNATAATAYGSGGGGGGGAGSNNESGDILNGGLATSGISGVVLIRYQYQ